MKPGNRQFIEMVPIHTKQFALEDGREDESLSLSAILQKGFSLF